MSELLLPVFVVSAVIIFLIVFLYFVPVNLWITAIFSGVEIGLLELVFMRIRKVPPNIIVNCLITLRKAGINTETAALETHYLAGGKLADVTRALIMSKKADLDLSWKDLTTMDLKGKNVVEFVRQYRMDNDKDAQLLRKYLSDRILFHLGSDDVKKVNELVEKLEDRGRVSF